MEANFSLDKCQLDFLKHYQEYGFKDQSEVVCTALNRLQAELNQESLRESAELYAEIYQEDGKLPQFTESALSRLSE